jgi:DNA-binding transcriptional LysR family regulator
MDFDLRQLEIFKKVVELRSYSKAAESVHLAQASVSERMATLERTIGTKLLDRISREVVPTKAGKLLYKWAVKHLELKKQTCLELEEFLGIRKGDVEIGGSTIPAEYILPGVLMRFRRQYPDIIVRLSMGSSEAIARQVLEGTFELGVVGAHFRAKRLESLELWRDELALVVHPSHKWVGRHAITLKELGEEPFIERESGSGTRQIIQQQLARKSDEEFKGFRVVSQLGSSTAVKEGVSKGLGVSILSNRAVAAEIESGSLKIVPLNKISLQRSFFLIRDRGRTMSPLCRALFEFLQLESAEDSRL